MDICTILIITFSCFLCNPVQTLPVLEPPARVCTSVTEKQIPISCASGVIAINSFKYGYKFTNYTASCDITTVYSSEDCFQSELVEDLYVDACSGLASCSAFTTQGPITGTCVDDLQYSSHSKYNTIEYYCIPEDSILHTHTDASLTLSGETVYIQNEDYSDFIHPTEDDSTCSVEIQACASNISLYTIHADLYGTTSNCLQSVQFTDADNNVLKIIACDDQEYNIIRNETLATHYAVLTLSNTQTTIFNDGGRFWFGFQGTEEAVVVDVHCPAQPSSWCKDCVTLSAPENGSIDNGENNVTGIIVTFTCDEGYDLDGNWTLTCMQNSNWNGTTPTCTPKDCGQLVAPVDGTVTTADGTTYGNSATYTCDAGYIIIDDVTRACNSTGQWTGKAPKCNKKDCGSLSSPSNGHVSYSPDTLYTAVVTYICDTGYTLNGTSTRTCTSTGSWDNAAPSCDIKDCGFPPTTDNVYVTAADGTTYGETATYSCDTGYETTDDNSTLCGGGGQWTGTIPTCLKKDCGPPAAPTNGNVSYPDGTKYEASATYSCKPEYEMFDAAITTCGSDGQWTIKAPKCYRKNCSSLTSPSNGAVTLILDTVLGAKANFTCNTGYELNGTKTRTCLSIGSWENGIPTCDIKDCGLPGAPVNGEVTVGNTTYGATAIYNCDTGYTFELSTFIETTCDGNGNWTNIPSACNKKDCGNISSHISHSSVKFVPDTLFGAVATFICDTGYDLNGSNTSICDSTGTWNNFSVSCDIKDCKSTSVDNAVVDFATSETLYEAVATVTCKQGYDQDDVTNITCQADGTWSTKPNCTIQDCGDPSPSDGFAVTPRGTTYGKEAIIKCNLGYKLEDENAVHIFCRDGPMWSFTPICNKIVCQDPTPVNGSSTDTVFTYGTLVTITCDEDYNTDGSPTIICQDDGIWNDTTTCHPTDCGHPSPSHGTFVTTPSTLLGSNATVSCNAGYILNGSMAVTCTESGWDTSPTCDIEDCGSLPDPVKGSVDYGDGTEFGAIITYTCDAGYKLEGSTNRICTQYGNWSGTAPPTCVIKDCGDPSPSNGIAVTPRGTTYGEEAIIKCNLGYELEDENAVHIFCLDGPMWSSIPICNKIVCQDPTPVNGSTTDTVFTYGSTVTITCNAGYPIDGSPTIICQDNGTWNDTTTCNPTDCGHPPIPHGTFVATSGTLLGGNVTISCSAGYTLNGSMTVTCTESGWDTSPTCNIKDCGFQPDLANGSVNYNDGTKFGAIITYSCDAGYDLVGGSTRTCTRYGNWSRAAPPTCIIRDCGPLFSPQHGSVNVSQGTKFGNSAAYTCDVGYKLSGNGKRDCNQFGNWSGTSPSCSFIDCGPLPNPPDGSVDISNGTHYGDSATYSCTAGYNLSSDVTRNCGQGGNWSGTPPVCIMKDCDLPPDVKHGSVDVGQGTKYDATATYTCNDGYTLSGDATRSCTRHGNWTGVPPTCIIKDCGSLPSPNDGDIDHLSNGTKVGASVAYTCNKGYVISGNDTRTCTRNGTWSGEVPVCNPKDCGSAPSILNGRIELDVVSNTKYNATATVKCNVDYKTKLQTIVCQDTGTWKKSTCTPKDRSMSNTVLITIISVAAFVLVLMAILLSVYCYTKLKRKKNVERSFELTTPKSVTLLHNIQLPSEEQPTSA